MTKEERNEIINQENEISKKYVFDPDAKYLPDVLGVSDKDLTNKAIDAMPEFDKPSDCVLALEKACTKREITLMLYAAYEKTKPEHALEQLLRALKT